MTQKIMTESHVMVSSGDKTRYIREGCSVVSIELDNPNDRIQRREWIRSNLRMCRRNPAEQGRLSGIRVTNKTNVGNLTKFQQKKAFFSWLTLSELPRRAVS